jgi:hypothetical protein
MSMKKIYSFLTLLLLVNAAYSQVIPNTGFENWVNNTESPHTYSVPQKWISIDALESTLYGYFGDSTYVVNSVTQAAGHSGNAAVQMAVVQSNEGDTIAGGVYSESSATNFFNVAFGGSGAMGFPLVARPASLTGYRKFNRVGNDSASIGIIMTKWIAATHTRDTIVDLENYYFTTSAAAWTQFSITLPYMSTLTPDTCLILAGIFADVPHPGTVFTLDDLAFAGVASGISETAAPVSMVSVFPDPFSTSATLRFSNENLHEAQLEIFDVAGNKVRVLSDLNGEDVIFNREGLNDGIYFYRLLNEGEVVASGKFSVQ